MIDFLKRFSRNRGAVIGAMILTCVVLLAIFAPLIYPESPWKMVQRPFLEPFSTEGFPLGTDTLGRDVAAGQREGLVHQVSDVPAGIGGDAVGDGRRLDAPAKGDHSDPHHRS